VTRANTMDSDPDFAKLVEAYRHELQVHCYRMLGSYEDSEDLVQETLLRAWRRRDSFEGRSTVRAWLYRIATNACLDFLDGTPRQATTAEITWLQPYPDELLDLVAPSDHEPDTAVIAKETIALAFMAAIQHLPPRQRAVLILRDVLGWRAREAAEQLGCSVASANSALQRARLTMKTYLPERRADWAPPADLSEQERALLQRYMDAHERADAPAVAELLTEDARLTMPPHPFLYDGRVAIMTLTEKVFDPASERYIGQWRYLPTRANRQPATAAYVRRPGDTLYRPQVLDVLTIAGGRVTEVTAFMPSLFPSFGLPAVLPP
jgi:RNA polymerase sigma-70 factor (ECF subfamily)